MAKNLPYKAFYSFFPLRLEPSDTIQLELEAGDIDAFMECFKENFNFRLGIDVSILSMSAVNASEPIDLTATLPETRFILAVFIVTRGLDEYKLVAVMIDRSNSEYISVCSDNSIRSCESAKEDLEESVNSYLPEAKEYQHIQCSLYCSSECPQTIHLFVALSSMFPR